MEWRKKISSEKRPPRNGLLALSPLLVMAVLFVALGLLDGDFGRVPLLMVFVLTAIYALLTLRGLPLESRITVFSRGAGESDLSALTAYGRAFGLLFQATDDLLDVTGTSGDMGKTLGKDAESGKLTCVSAYGLEGTRARVERCHRDALDALIFKIGLAGGQGR